MFQRTVIETSAYESMRDHLDDVRDQVLADNLVKCVCARFQKTAHTFVQQHDCYTATFPQLAPTIAFKHLECLHQQDPRAVDCVHLRPSVLRTSLPSEYNARRVFEHGMSQDMQKRAQVVVGSIDLSVCVNKQAHLDARALSDTVAEEQDETPYFKQHLLPLDLTSQLDDWRDRQMAQKIICMMHSLYPLMPLLTTSVSVHDSDYSLVFAGYSHVDSRALSRVHRDLQNYILACVIKSECRPYSLPLRATLSVHLRVRKCATPATISFVDMSLCATQTTVAPRMVAILAPIEAIAPAAPSSAMEPAAPPPPTTFSPPTKRYDSHEWNTATTKPVRAARPSTYDLPPSVDTLDERLHEKRRAEKRRLHTLVDASPLPTDTEDDPKRPHRAIQRIHDDIEYLATLPSTTAFRAVARSLF